MINVPSQFHTYALDPSNKTSISIYSFPNGLNEYHFDDDQWIQSHGDIIRYGTDYNSNGRIAQDGIKISEVVCKSDQIEFGCSSSKTLEITFINDDGYFATYDWTRPIVIQFFYSRTDLGVAYCSLGVFWFEKPAKTSSRQIKAIAHDSMYMLDQIMATDYINNVWNSSGTLNAKVRALQSYVSTYYVTVDQSLTLLNGTYTYSSNPFPNNQISIRKVLEYIAGVASSNAKIDAANSIAFNQFTYTGLSFEMVDSNNVPISTNIISIERADYTTEMIDKVSVATGSNGFAGSSGSGDNVLWIYNNPLLASQSQVTNIYNFVSDSTSLPEYTPCTIKMYADVSIEAGDRFSVLVDRQSLERVYVLQQTLTWKGGPWIAEIVSNGPAKRINNNSVSQYQYGVENGIYGAKLKYYDEPSGSNYTLSSGGYAYVAYPNGLKGNQIVAVGVNSYSSATGAFSVAAYGGKFQANGMYIYGTPGTVITNISFRYWYLG